MTTHDPDTGGMHRAVQPLRRALYDYDAAALEQALTELCSPDATVRLAHPFEDLDGPLGFARQAIAPLAAAWPDLERRDTIVVAGRALSGADWLGCCGYYTGTFVRPWLGIPPTGHQVAMRFHEFFRFEDGKVVDIQALWDLPEVMLQAGVWPMVPSLGREWHVPGPATQDGLGPHDKTRSEKSLRRVSAMLAALGNFAEGGVAAMRLEDHWHPKFSWYGPSGIGTGRGVAGFRAWHQIPFLNAMPDRVGSVGAGHLFGEGSYVGFTAWPGMHMTVSGDGWLGIAPSGKRITMRSLDFWRCEGDAIRENWVLVDLLHVYDQLGVDVLARMREIAGAREGAGW
ncbi:MAG: ester cyclase [Pseudomonadota bacterium]